MACMNARKYGTNNRLSRLRQIETCTDSPQLRAELEKLKRLVDAHPKGLNTTFKITKRKRRSNISTRPRRKLFAQGLPSYFLFEFASGYALFHGHGVDDLPLSRYDVHEKYINRTDQIFKLKAFYPFSSSADALIQMIAISNSTVTPQLKSFLVDNLPKTIHGKGSSCLVATSNTLLAHNIGITTRLGVRCGGFCDNFMRGLRMKIDKFIDGLEPKDLEKQRLNLAHLYSRQRCTTMVAKSSKAITPRGKKRCPSMVVRSSKAIAPTSLQQFVVVPHKFEGVFIAQGKEEDFICTRNLVPGEALYDEELIYIQNEDGTDVEYRVWNPLRSKLGAAILCGVKNICVKPGSRILYLGDVCEITVSHLSDLVGSDGLVYVVGISDVVVNMLEKRPNVITIIEKPMLCWNYRMVLGMVDVIFADIAYPIANPYQGHWFFINAKFYLRAGGHYMISTRENNINGLHTNFDFQREFNPIELVKLEPIVRESVLDVGSYRVPNEAVYHGPDIFLLDDVLSAVDAEVAQWILSNAILGPLMNQKTRILCTHNVQIGVALYLLYTQVKLAFVAGTAITILLIPVNKWIAKAVADATRSMMKQKDERIRRAGELLTYIRTLKMYGWELLFFSWLMKARSSEVTFLSTRKYLDAWCVFFWATTPTLFSFCTFGLYALMGNQLDAATVFTCLALFNNLISPLNSFPWVINGLIDAIISASHLSRFLCCPEIETETSSDNYLSSCTDEYPCVTGEDVAVVINEACCLWSSNDQEQLVMDHVSLSLSKGHLVAVVGEVGSGKSSLLSCILRETRIIKGFVYLGGSIAYVPQVPWILSGSIRDNVVLGDEYDPRRLSDILKACAMDIDVSRMNGGDMAFIGVKGVNLSGGQRARLALARAVYHGPDIFLLDDVLSAVDAEVAQWILSNAILGPLMNQKTRILCTHNVQAISSADTVVLIDKGQVRWVGSPSSFSISSYIAPSLREDFIISSKVQNQDKDVDAQEKVLMDSEDIHVLEEAPYSLEVEQRKEGRVELVTYKNYAAFCGWSITILTCLSAIFMQASRNGNDVWLSYWVDTTGYQTSFYLVVLCIFCVVNSSLTLVRAFSFAFGGLRAAVQVHDRLLKNLVNAPVQFFDQTPSGRKLNRLSSDLYTIDETLPFILNILLANFVGLLGIAIVLSYVQVMFLLLLLPFWYIYNKLQFYYRSTSRELRRLDSVSRSPIYDSFTEILNGSSTIRAFKTEFSRNDQRVGHTNTQDVFFARFTEKVILYQRTSYSETIANLWLSLRLQLLAAVIVSFVAVMAVVGSHGHLLISFGSPGKVGLALSYAAPVVSLLGNFLTSFTETEKELVSVERVLQYMDIAQEELHGCHLDTDWPLHGNIEFLNVTLQYMPSLPAALCDITCTFSAGTQTGIVGRTGAGKSSILNVLFRLNPLSGGCILVDGINIANISLRDLRSRFSVVPQTPFLFEGSLRDNLDPFRVNDDLKIWDSLAKCQVEEEVKAMGGLDMHVKESGTPFSVGQRQLLCLARAFLKSSKVLCLDECTANVDTSTALKLQNAITSKCRGITVITIAHRIPTVLNMDTIVILDQGSLVEQGNPQALVQDKMSRFSSFVKASSTRN